MPTRKTPKLRAIVSGAALKNPQRYRGGPDPVRARPLGEPYAKMTAAQKRAWAEYAKELPWLRGSHRVLLRLACIWTARMDGKDFGVSAAQTLASLLAKLGASPTDEHRVNYTEPEGGEPEDRFFQ